MGGLMRFPRTLRTLLAYGIRFYHAEMPSLVPGEGSVLIDCVEGTLADLLDVVQDGRRRVEEAGQTASLVTEGLFGSGRTSWADEALTRSDEVIALLTETMQRVTRNHECFLLARLLKDKVGLEPENAVRFAWRWLGKPSVIVCRRASLPEGVNPANHYFEGILLPGHTQNNGSFRTGLPIGAAHR